MLRHKAFEAHAAGPSYVLRREGESEAWRESVYSFQPVPDPDRPGQYVRVSGASSDRERQNLLRLLTDHFFSGAIRSSASCARISSTRVDGLAS
jgi:hypothetical protein